MPVPDIDREQLDVLDAIYSTRAMRYLKPDPVPDELIHAVLPINDSDLEPAVQQYLLVRQWSGHDFGYLLGADPGENNKTLARYHEWAKKPRPPTETAGSELDEAGASSLTPTTPAGSRQ